MENEPPHTGEEGGVAAAEIELNSVNPEPVTNHFGSLINTFCEITSASQSEALFYLESHNFNLESAISTFLEPATPSAVPAAAALTTDTNHNTQNRNSLSESPGQSESHSPSKSESESESGSESSFSFRSRSRTPPPSRRPQYNLRSSSSKPSRAAGRGRRRRGIRTSGDLDQQPTNDGSDGESDDHEKYHTVGEKSGILVETPFKENSVNAIFDQVRQSASLTGPLEDRRAPSSSRSFTGTVRLLSGEAAPSVPQPPEIVMHNITFWRNGFTVDGGPLRRLDDPGNSSLLESIKRSECPEELEPADKRAVIHVNLIRRDENCPVPKKTCSPFQGVGRTLGGSSNTTSMEATVTSFIATAPVPLTGLVVDQALPSTSIQLRLADGTRMVSRFNNSHTIRDIRDFIDASSRGGAITYQLQTVGFPPKQLNDLEQTIEQAGIANSVVIQKV